MSENIINHPTDLAPYYNHATDESISYDISGTLKLLTDHFNLNILKLGTMLVDSVSDPLKRTLSTTEFYFKVPFDATGVLKNTFKTFGHDSDSYFKSIIAKLPKLISGAIDVFTPSSYWLAAPFYMPIELVHFGSLCVRNFAQPIINAAVASTILNHNGFTYCNHVDQNICGKCCLAEEYVSKLGANCLIRGRFNCGQLVHYNNCVFGGVNYKPEVMDAIENFWNATGLWV
ncbi:12475_t:CDS:2 [Funneliformis mosseae]|uniref:12475_t:CDS:1 n=1 Tax=Funneliformis mosseae TaxID=27381 RepID=A0A9N9GEB4_FUNMO|nr:12475_t:CDS:2 [Funneliformis mosseae]